MADVTGDNLFITGNAGIGTNTPQQQLSVEGALNLDQANTNNGSHLPGLTFGSFSGEGISSKRTGGGNQFGLDLYTASSPRLSITSTGNVGIGTTNPISTLQVAGDAALHAIPAAAPRSLPAGATMLWNDGTWLRLNQNLDYSKPVFGLHTPGVFAPISLNVGGAGNWGDPGSGNVWVTGNVGIGLTAPRTPLHVLGRISTGRDFASAGAITFFPPDGFAWFHIDNGPAGGRPIGRLRFSFGGQPGEREIMSMLQNSNVGIGTPAPQVKLHTVGNRIRIDNGAGNTLDLRADGSALDLESNGQDLFINNNGRAVNIRNLRQTSSRELKENIADFSVREAMEVLAALNAVVFNYKDDEEKRAQLGFIAEDAPKVVAAPDRKSILPMHILAVLSRVVQEQQRMIASLRRELYLRAET